MSKMLVEFEGQEYLLDRCPVNGCENSICYALDSDKCYPHTHGLQPELMDDLADILDKAKVTALTTAEATSVTEKVDDES